LDFLDHLLDEAVDQLLAITKVTTLGEMISLLTPASTSVVQLEVPQEVVGDFEVRADGEDLMDEILDADDAELAQPLLDDIVAQGASTTLKFSVAALVHELADRLEVRITPSDVGIGDAQHAQRRLVQLHESRIVDLTQTEKLKYLPDSRVESVDTPDSHDNGQLGFGRNVEVAVFAGVSGQTKFLSVSFLVLLSVSLGLLKDGQTFGLIRLLFEESSFELFGTKAGLCLPLLQKRLGDSGNRVSRHLYVNYLNFKQIESTQL